MLARGTPAAPRRMLIVEIAPSAGRPDALRKLISALPTNGSITYILVQHLDQAQKHLMVELLAEHTAKPVSQVTQDVIIELNYVNVISAISCLSVSDGALHRLKPTAPSNARMPVDFLLESMVNKRSNRAIAIILSGTGSDSTLGVGAVHHGSAFVLAQDSVEFEYDDMPQSAVASARVDVVLTVTKMPAALAGRLHGLDNTAAPKPPASPHNALPRTIGPFRKNTPHDFTLYKIAALQRQIERRMTLASIPVTDMARNRPILERVATERCLLDTDLLINVTSFFRDLKIFELCAKTIVPDVVRLHTEDRPLRIWIAGCSTGEKTYSLAMTFVEAIAVAKQTIKLCVVASDVDPDVVATAREGHYSKTTTVDISSERLARFFMKYGHVYNVLPELCANAVFTIQDLLADPPISKLDFVLCRNVLIYLGPDTQTKVIALFYFAPRRYGVLLLVTSETVDQDPATAHWRTLPGLFRRLVLENYPSAPCSSIVAKNTFIRGIRPNAICALCPSIQRMTRSRWRHRDRIRGSARPLIKSAGRSQTSPLQAGV